MTPEEVTIEVRWVPIAESGDRWAPRTREEAHEAMKKYPAGGTYADGEPWDGVTHILAETRTVTPWCAIGREDA